jgi:hypothetical protein
MGSVFSKTMTKQCTTHSHNRNDYDLADNDYGYIINQIKFGCFKSEDYIPRVIAEEWGESNIMCDYLPALFGLKSKNREFVVGDVHVTTCEYRMLRKLPDDHTRLILYDWFYDTVGKRTNNEVMYGLPFKRCRDIFMEKFMKIHNNDIQINTTSASTDEDHITHRKLKRVD